MVTQASNTSTGEVEAGRSRVQSCSHLYSAFEVSLGYMSYLKSRHLDLRAQKVTPELLSQEAEPTEQAPDASEQADTSKQNTETSEATTQQDVDTDVPEAPPPPLEPAVMARPGCVNLSLHGILEDRRPKERISFEASAGECHPQDDSGANSILVLSLMPWYLHLFQQVVVLAELFLEMLQRDFGYRIYKMLLSLPEKVVSPPEPEKEEATKEDVVKEEVAKVSKDEVQNEGTAAESDNPLVSAVLSPGGLRSTHYSA